MIFIKYGMVKDFSLKNVSKLKWTFLKAYYLLSYI